MLMLIHALAAGGLAAVGGTPNWAGPALAGRVPNPAPVAPPGLSGDMNTLLAWWKWGALIAGVFGLIGCGAMMAIGRRNRSSLAADGANPVGRSTASGQGAGASAAGCPGSRADSSAAA